jgi:hypothetical protein
MQTQNRGNRALWLISGVLIGLGISYFWPHEPLRADQSDRNDKFGMISCTATLPIAGIAGTEAIFVLDFLTGQLKGFYCSPQVGGFTQSFFRDVAKDFELDRKGGAQASYAFVGGQGQVIGNGGTWGSSMIYVAELTTGTIAAYAFPFTQQNQQIATQLMTLVDKAQFKDATVQ